MFRPVFIKISCYQFLRGDDSIVSDADVLRTDFGTAFCNVPVANA